MSSSTSQSKNYINNLTQKFENQYKDINRLLDNVLQKSSGVIDIQESPNYNNSAFVSPDRNVVLNKIHTGEASNEKDLSNVLSTAGSQNITPVKNKTDFSQQSTADFKRYGTPNQNDDSYDYGKGQQYYTPKQDAAKLSTYVPQLGNLNRPQDTSQEMISDTDNSREYVRNQVEPSTFMAAGSKDVSSLSARYNINNKLNQSNDGIDYLTSYNNVAVSNQGTERYREQDISGSFDVTQSIDFTGAKCKIPRKTRIENPVRNSFRDSFDEYQLGINYTFKYAPLDVLRSVEKSEDGQFYVCNAVSNRPTTPEQDPIDQIVVLANPVKEVVPADGLAGIYQQVNETYTDGTSYIGEKFLGLRQGKGTYYFHGGYRYEGSWHEDQMDGFGILWLADDFKWYEGEWKNGVFHGKGIIYNPAAEDLEPGKTYSKDLNEIGNGWAKYEGAFENGSKHGFGTLFLCNDDTFTGHFESDNVQGRGSYMRAEPNELLAGKWENNVLAYSY